MDRLVVIPAQLLLFTLRPGTQRHFDIPLRVFAAHHEADLTRWVGRNGGVGVFDSGKHFPAALLKVGDERQMQPLVLRYRLDGVSILERRSEWRWRRGRKSGVGEAVGRKANKETNNLVSSLRRPPVMQQIAARSRVSGTSSRRDPRDRCCR